MDDCRVTVVGLGKLGSPLAACFASRGLAVFGVDADERKLAALRAGKAPVYEPQLQELIDEHSQRLTPTSDMAFAVQNSQATFVLVSTPSDDFGNFSLQNVLPVCRRLGAALAQKNEYHLVVIASTVSPGAIENHILPELERASGKRCGDDFGLCHSPEFVALGAVVSGYLQPDFALIGQFDERSGDALETIYQRYFPKPTPCVRTSLISAELAKVALNTYMTVKISFANVVAQLCERIPGADAEQVSAAIGHDRRIGPAYLKGALSYGGPCFPRDVAAFRAVCEQVGVPTLLPDALHRVNELRQQELLALVERQMAARQDVLVRPPCVAVLGLAFKPNTDVIEASPGLELARSLCAAGHSVVVHDPAAKLPAEELWLRTSTALEAVAAADVVVIATPWRDYRNLPVECWKEKIVVDCWRQLPAAELHASTTHIPLGLGSAAPHAGEEPRAIDISDADTQPLSIVSADRVRAVA